MTTTETTTEGQGDPGAGDETLGDAGKRALESERQLRRQAEQRARAAEGRVAEMERAETDRKRAEEVAKLRAEVAEAKGLPPSLARRLTGESREDMEADADEMLEAVGPQSSAPSRPPSRRPVENLSGGGDPTGDHAPDAKTMADKILARGL